MTTSMIGYGRVYIWVKCMLGATHGTVIKSIAWMVLCLLMAQHLTTASLARALPAERSGQGCNRQRWVRRCWQGPELALSVVTPLLIRLALALVPRDQTVIVALDTTRVGPWEVWVMGVVWMGRTLPIAWAVLPYPWPKGEFRKVTLALVKEVQAAMPAGTPWVLVADRAFPKPLLLAQLASGDAGWTIRLRLNSWVQVAGCYAPVVEHLEAGRIKPGQRVLARIGRGTTDQTFVSAWLVVNQTVPSPPRHKDNPGTRRERERREKARAQHLADKGPKPPSPAAQRYARTWVLFTTAQGVEQAVKQYASRMAIEETFRDWHCYWGMRKAASSLPTKSAVSRMVGTVCLAYMLQIRLGHLLSQDGPGQWRCLQWTSTGRVSYFWCGAQLFHDPGYDWSNWLDSQWRFLLMPGYQPLDQAA